MLEIQIAQQANSSTTPPGRLPCKPELNPRKQCNAIVLRNGTQLEGPKGVSEGVESEKESDKGVDPLPPSDSEPQEKRESEKQEELKTLPPKPYMPLLPFP